MTEEELLKRCSEKTNRPRLFWVSEIYGFGPVIRAFGFFPKQFPLNIYTSHGVALYDKPAPHELKNSAPVMFYFSKKLVSAFKQVSPKPCFCFIAPNVFFRRSHRIVRDNDAKGTLVFFAHTTPMIEDKLNHKVYLDQLRALPEKYQPISICLHYHDVNKGVHKQLMSEGFEVLTVGNAYDDKFISHFYDILRRFRYATSNILGSYTYYCAEMGIPFFLHGSEPQFFNHGDENIESGKYESYKHQSNYQKAYHLFQHPTDEVTAEQKTFAEEVLGVHDTISRTKMASLLYRAYFRHLSTRIKVAVYRFITFRWLDPYYKKLEVRAQRLNFHFQNYRKFGFAFAHSFRANLRKKTVTLFGRNISYSNEFWFLHSLHEIFVDKTYWFKSDSPTPTILDCGSNVGLSVIYFKQLYPQSKVIAFEPDASNFNLLQRNLTSFGLTDVELNKKAIWSEDTVLLFSSSASSVGSKVDKESVEGHGERVEAVSLSSYLKNQVVDFLKLDIEGAEVEVIASSREYLKNVKNIFIEYHSLPDDPQQLHKLLQILQEAGFRYYIKEAWENITHPYVLRNPVMFDLQLNIFGYRTS
jgi:FkbM family methyltransferase